MHQSLAERVAGNVRAEMARAGVSQVELARRLGRSQQYITSRVVGSVSFGVDELETVASALGTTIDQLLSERAVKAGA